MKVVFHKMKKRILISGGTGFLGYHLSKNFVKKGFQVVSISTKGPLKKRKIKKVKYIICDISNKNMLQKKLKNKKFAIVINLAGYVHHGNLKKTYQSHYLGCKNLSEFFKHKSLDYFIQIGSGLEYGKKNSDHKENMICKPLSIYAKAKLKSSRYLLNLYKKYQFPVVILRLYQVYGPHQDQNRILPSLIHKSLQNKKFPCTSGSQIRNFLYVDDFINLVEKIVKTKRYYGNIFNVGSNKSIKIKSLINQVMSKVGLGMPEFGKIKMRKDEAKKMSPSILKVTKTYNWRPKINLSKGLTKTINYYRRDK